MRFAIALPQFVADGSFDPGAFRRYLARAEQLGFESAWTQEQPLGSNPCLSPLETLTYAAACSERIRLGCSVFVTPLHQPVQLAKALSSLDQLSRGRLEIGIGNGGQARLFGAYGIDGEHLVTRFNEGIELMRDLWTEEQVSFSGRFYALEGIGMEPKPFQKPHPPLWFGGSHPAALRRAVRHGDGFFGAGSQPTERYVTQVRTIREELERAGRDPATFRVTKRVYLAVDEDADRARERVGAALGRVYAHFDLPDLTPVAVFGPPAAVIAGLAAVRDAGAELILANPLFDEPEQMERLAAEVLPALD